MSLSEALDTALAPARAPAASLALAPGFAVVAALPALGLAPALAHEPPNALTK